MTIDTNCVSPLEGYSLIIGMSNAQLSVAVLEVRHALADHRLRGVPPIIIATDRVYLAALEAEKLRRPLPLWVEVPM